MLLLQCNDLRLKKRSVNEKKKRRKRLPMKKEAKRNQQRILKEHPFTILAMIPNFFPFLLKIV